MSFDKAHDVCQIFLPFTPTALLIGVSPHFALQDILEIRNVHRISEYLSLYSTGKKILISTIGLNLNPQVRFLNGEVHAMLILFNFHASGSGCAADSFNASGHNNKVQVKTDDRFCIGIDGKSPTTQYLAPVSPNRERRSWTMSVWPLVTAFMKSLPVTLISYHPRNQDNRVHTPSFEISNKRMI